MDLSVRKTSTLRTLRESARTTFLRGLWVWFRHRGLRSSDVFLACYPRSGSNWLQFLVYSSVTGGEAGFDVLRSASPYVGSHRRSAGILPGGRRFIKTHEQYHTVYRKAIYLVRDPRDIVFSDFRFLTERGDFQGSFDEFVDVFVHGRAHGFGSWGDHVRSWTESPLAGTHSLIRIRYEDLRSDPGRELSRILSFLEAEVSPADIDKAIQDNAIELMAAKDSTDQGSAGPGTRPFRYVNQGRVGRWRDSLGPDQEGRILDAFSPEMMAVGYVTGHDTF